MEYLEKQFFLKEKKAIVTGANRGIGRAIALALASAGSSVCVVASTTRNLEETAESIRKLGVDAYSIQADLKDRSRCLTLIDEAQSLLGRIDILVNNAGIIRRSEITEGRIEDWDEVMAINIDAMYILSRQVSKLMRKQKSGKIINIASLLSFQGGKFVPAYTASKHAVAGLTKSFANELAPDNINVNAIAPGYIKTENTQALQDDKQRYSEILSRIPAARWGESEDIANTAVFLASKASTYIHGHILAVDGGWLAH